MITLLIASFLGAFSSVLASLWLTSQAWIITIGFTVFLAAAIILNRIFGKRLTNLVNDVQEMLKETQAETTKMINRFQARPAGSQKMMQTKVEKIMEAGVLRALERLNDAESLFKWSLLAERQVNTLKVQLYFQIQRFDDVDRYIPKILVMDPMTLAMKMTRQYHLKSPDLDKSFRKGVKKFKYEKAVLIYSLYAWILIKQKDNERALAVLDEAKEKTDDETIQRNWQHVANNKIHLFSNSGLGEQWFALHLEAPPKARAGKGQMKGNPMAPKRRRKHF